MALFYWVSWAQKHGNTSQEIGIFNSTAVRTSNFVQCSVSKFSPSKIKSISDTVLLPVVKLGKHALKIFKMSVYIKTMKTDDPLQVMLEYH